jgi:hypothetical protein
VAGSCECGKEPSGPIKCGEFLVQLMDLLASQEGLCFLKIASQSVTKLIYWKYIHVYPRNRGIPRPEKQNLKIKEINGSQVSKRAPRENGL